MTLTKCERNHSNIFTAGAKPFPEMLFVHGFCYSLLAPKFSNNNIMIFYCGLMVHITDTSIFWQSFCLFTVWSSTISVFRKIFSLSSTAQQFVGSYISNFILSSCRWQHLYALHLSIAAAFECPTPVDCSGFRMPCTCRLQQLSNALHLSIAAAFECPVPVDCSSFWMPCTALRTSVFQVGVLKRQKEKG